MNLSEITPKREKRRRWRRCLLGLLILPTALAVCLGASMLFWPKASGGMLMTILVKASPMPDTISHLVILNGTGLRGVMEAHMLKKRFPNAKVLFITERTSQEVLAFRELGGEASSGTEFMMWAYKQLRPNDDVQLIPHVIETTLDEVLVLKRWLEEQQPDDRLNLLLITRKVQSRRTQWLVDEHLPHANVAVRGSRWDPINAKTIVVDPWYLAEGALGTLKLLVSIPKRLF